MLYFYFLRCALTSLLVLWMTESALSIVCAYFLCDDNISFSKSRCSPLCGAVSRWDVLCGSWGQTWVLHTRVRVTFTLSVWAQGKHPVPTCETGSPESWDHAQLPLLSHRSVSPPSFTESCGFPVSRFIWSDSCRACPVCFRLRGEENHLCFFFGMQVYSSARGLDVALRHHFLLFVTHCPQAVIVWDLVKDKHIKFCWISVNSHVIL